MVVELQQQLLKTDKGLAIIPTPDSGELAPYQELVIALSLYTDMWGEYNDVLTCQVGNLDPFNILMKVNVTGIPIQFHMASTARYPTLR